MPNQKENPVEESPVETSAELTEEQKQQIDDCTTIVISLITRSAYLIQSDQIRYMFITDDRIRARIDTIIIEEIEEILADINVLSNCEFFNYIDDVELRKLLDEFGDLDVNKARQYGDSVWDMFSKILTNYVIETWKYRPR